MRTTRILFMTLALAGVLEACQRIDEPDSGTPQPVTEAPATPIIFVSERPQPESVRPQAVSEAETRTHWDDTEGTILWDAADQIRMGYTVDGIWQNGSGNASSDAKLFASTGTTLTEGGAVASFETNPSFAGTTAGTHVFHTVYPASAAGETMASAPVATVTVPAVQTPLSGSYDPSADLMLGHSFETITSRPTVPVRILWERVVAHGVITLQSLPGVASGETVRTVTLTAQDGANMVGAQSMDITTGAYETAAANTAANKLVVKGDNLSIDEGGNLTFWISILPVTLTELTVEVATDRATYTRSIAGFERIFRGNGRNKLSINMARAARASMNYEKVTSEREDWTGDYLIVNTPNGKALSSIEKINSNTCGISSAVTITGNEISHETYQGYNIRIEKAGTDLYTLKLEQGTGSGYLGWSSGNTLISASTAATANYLWSISLGESGNVLIVNQADNRRRIMYNYSNPRFCAYTNETETDNVKFIQLYQYRYEEPTDPLVVTKPATEVYDSKATLNARFANLGTNVQNAHFLWGTSADALVNELDASAGTDIDAGTFEATLYNLTPGTTYYYKAVIQYCTDGQTYQSLSGEVLSFTTESTQPALNPGLMYLGCYEMPAISLVDTERYSDSGTETFGTTNWYNYVTTDPMQKVVTHTYAYEGSVYRNYTALIDGNRRCPLWTAYVMHKDAYPNLDAGRGKFSTETSYDPGIDRSWQSSGSTSDYNSGNGYARGHHCASEDRQTTEDANWQTFYYTNQSPQWQNSFNGGIWATLEGAVQSHAPTGRDTLYVVVGTLFTTNNTGSSNDGGTVGRPSHFYKCLMKCSFGTDGSMTGASGVAYLFENRAYTGGENYNDPEDGIIRTIKDIEDLSGFDFFTNVPASLQAAAEAVATPLW